MRIPYFGSIFIRTKLPVEGVRQNESGIVNLNNAYEGPDTHWVAYAKRGNRVMYFDSFDNLQPPKKFEWYLANNVIKNKTRVFLRDMNDRIIFTRADKGNVTVALDRQVHFQD